MTEDQIVIISSSTEQTRQAGEKTGEILNTGIVLALTGDLGSGKTVFVQGLAKGLAVSEKYYINSPTYTLINAYPGRMQLVHTDLYRLNGPDDIESTGLYDMADGSRVVAVEWPDRLDPEDFSEYLSLNIRVVDDQARELIFKGHGANGKELIEKLAVCFKEQKWL